jgi:Spy/CpxP family protein refolding chaperone
MTFLRTAVLGLALTVGTTAVAQAQTTTPAPQAGQHRGHDVRGPGARAMGGRADRGALRGITLSDAQKAQLKTVHEKYRAQHEAERARLKPVMDAVRAARQRGDTAAARAAWAKAGEARTQGAATMKQEMNDVRAVLTAEQQKQFDANAAKMAAGRGQAMKHRGGRKAGKAGKVGAA